jgi:hypothetical protein
MTSFAARSVPPERELGAPAPLLTEGDTLIVYELGDRLAAAVTAHLMLRDALERGDKRELLKGAECLVAALNEDPLVLARRILRAVKS